MITKYHIGQAVRVIPRKPIKLQSLNWADEMTRWCNKIVIISAIESCTRDGFTEYHIKEDNGQYYWREDWLLLRNFRIQDMVRIKQTGEIVTITKDTVYKDEDLELISRRQLI